MHDPPAKRARALVALAITASAVLAIDRLTKSWAVAHLLLQPPVELWPGVLHLALYFNTGVAFGLGAGAGAWLLAPAAIVVAAIALWLWRVRPGSSGHAVAGAVIGGVIGNGSDRVLREVPGFGTTRHAVVDFIAVAPGWWPAFNVADLAIVCGGIVLLVPRLRGFDRLKRC